MNYLPSKPRVERKTQTKWSCFKKHEVVKVDIFLLLLFAFLLAVKYAGICLFRLLKGIILNCAEHAQISFQSLRLV